MQRQVVAEAQHPVKAAGREQRRVLDIGAAHRLGRVVDDRQRGPRDGSTGWGGLREIAQGLHAVEDATLRGSHEHGADISAVAEKLSCDVKTVATTNAAFAALKNSGEVVIWGSHWHGGDEHCGQAPMQLHRLMSHNYRTFWKHVKAIGTQ